MSVLNNPILSLKKPPKRVAPEHCNLRFVDRKGRYMLQTRIDGVWYDIPLVNSLGPVEVVKP